MNNYEYDSDDELDIQTLNLDSIVWLQPSGDGRKQIIEDPRNRSLIANVISFSSDSHFILAADRNCNSTTHAEVVFAFKIQARKTSLNIGRAVLRILRSTILPAAKSIVLSASMTKVPWNCWTSQQMGHMSMMCYLRRAALR